MTKELIIYLLINVFLIFLVFVYFYDYYYMKAFDENYYRYQLICLFVIIVSILVIIALFFIILGFFIILEIINEEIQLQLAVAETFINMDNVIELLIIILNE